MILNIKQYFKKLPRENYDYLNCSIEFQIPKFFFLRTFFRENLSALTFLVTYVSYISSMSKVFFPEIDPIIFTMSIFSRRFSSEKSPTITGASFFFRQTFHLSRMYHYF